MIAPFHREKELGYQDVALLRNRNSIGLPEINEPIIDLTSLQERSML